VGAVPTPLRQALLAALPGQDRVVLRVTGEDGPRFLQGLLSADLDQAVPGHAIPAALLTVKGKIVSEIIVLAPHEDGALWLAVPRVLVDAVQAQLEGHVIMDDVVIERTELALGLVVGVGPETTPLPDALAAFAVTHPLAGSLVAGPLDSLAAWLAAQGDALDEHEFTQRRIAEARPAWGHELVPDHFPPELGFVDAVSYTKGCYMGQEPLSRIHNRGQVNRVMVRVEGPEVAASEPLELLLGDEVVGSWTSRAGVQGLAIVKRKHAEPGRELHTRAGERVLVRSGPLGDDPGGAGRTVTKVQLGGRR
jgi:hypothetical protein